MQVDSLFGCSPVKTIKRKINILTSAYACGKLSENRNHLLLEFLILDLLIERRSDLTNLLLLTQYLGILLRLTVMLPMDISLLKERN